ncbi:MAG: hypothetical protein H6832_12515 [Planctomycetes bacterium]|nr:hypothetical protein [Planctomycetota bacterium]MCB9919216.1 hypothetical protein [Planctomycetota bacterium]
MTPATNGNRFRGLAMVAICALAAATRSQVPVGIGVQPDADGSYWKITEVVPNSLAAKNGIRVGDRILEGCDASGEPIDLSVSQGNETFARFMKNRDFVLVLMRGSDQPLVRVKFHRDLEVPRNGSRPVETNETNPQSRSRRARSSNSSIATRVIPAEDRPARIVLKPIQIHDAEMNDMLSHTLLLPEAWKFEGGVRWNTKCIDNFVTFSGRVTAPSGATVDFFPTTVCRYADARTMQFAGDRFGMTAHDGFLIAPAPKRPGDAVLQIVLPRLRPRATNVTILDAAYHKEAEQAFAQTIRPLVEQQQNINNMTRAQGIKCDLWYHCDRVRVRYDEGGATFEEEFLCTTAGFESSFRAPQMQMQSGTWWLSDVRSMRAAVGKLDAQLPELSCAARSLRPTPKWSLEIKRIQRKVIEIKRRGQLEILEMLRKSREEISRIHQEISDIQMKSWRKDQADRDRVFTAMCNSIRSVEDYKTQDGDTVSIDNSYDRVFRTVDGRVIATNDPSYDPNQDTTVNHLDWSQLERIDYFR